MLVRMFTKGGSRWIHNPDGGAYGISNYVTSYKIMISSDGTNWDTVSDGGGEDIVFKSDTNGIAIVVNDMPPGLRSRYVRLHPLSWRYAIRLSWGILGC